MALRNVRSYTQKVSLIKLLKHKITKNDNNGYVNNSGENEEGLKLKQISTGNKEMIKKIVREEHTK